MSPIESVLTSIATQASRVIPSRQPASKLHRTWLRTSTLRVRFLGAATIACRSL